MIDAHIGGIFEGEGAGDSWWTLLPETSSTDLVERIANLAISKYIPWMAGHWQNDLIKSELRASRNSRIMPSAWLEFIDKK